MYIYIYIYAGARGEMGHGDPSSNRRRDGQRFTLQ